MKKRIASRKELFCAILLLGFISCIYAPFEMYALNTQDLWFSLKDFWYIPLACGVFAMAAATIFGLILKGKLLKIYTGFLLGFGLCVYVQGNFLNLKLGLMTGTGIDWSQYRGRLVLDALVWVLLIGVSIALCLWEKKIVQKVITGIPLFLTAVLFVTLMVLVIPCLKENKIPAAGYPTDKDLLSLSSNANVLVFVLDQYDVEFFSQVLQEVPEFEEQLDGFTWFDNFAGCYPRTQWAIPFMLSGRYCLQGDVGAYHDTFCAEDVYWDELIRNGYEMSIYSGSEFIPTRAGENAVNFVKADFRIADHKMFTVLLYRLVMCKYFPDFVKPYVWLQGYEFDHRRQLQSDYHYYNPENLTLGDYLDQHSMTDDADCPQFKFIHISGAHPPYGIDEWGRRTEDGSDQDKCIKGSLRLVLRYMDEMKALGMYDDSAIIITADHGRFTADCTSPLFLVKPCGAQGMLEVDHTPSSQVDLGATVLELTGVDMDGLPYGISVFDETGEKQKKRYYYKAVSIAADITGRAQEKLVEYEVDPAGIALENFHPTGVEYGMDGEKLDNGQ